jgi:hypothetical protein
MIWFFAIALSCKPAPNTRVNLTVDLGELPSLLQDQQQRAHRNDRKPYVFLYASTHAPSIAMRDQLDAPEIKDVLNGTWLIELDTDAWGAQIQRAGFSPQQLPALYAIDQDARPTNHSFVGVPWEDATPSLMAPPLRRFFHTTQTRLPPPTRPQ